MDSIISINGLVKRFGEKVAVNGLDLEIGRGELFGFLGPNGAGKSTTMRHIMGFSKADNGNITISNMDSWQDKEGIKKITGYLAGDVKRFNNGKRAEERDRVKHSGHKDLLKKNAK